MDKKCLFHGSRIEVRNPDISYSRTDIDFGAGFYLTQDPVMATKWACNKNKSVLNVYSCDLSGLNVKQFVPDKEWLDYVCANRLNEPTADYSMYDIIVGPTADDKMFNIIDMYMDDLISSENAIRVITVMNYSEQIVFKNQNAIQSGLHFEKSKEIHGAEKQHYIDTFKRDRQIANEKTKQILREINKGR